MKQFQHPEIPELMNPLITEPINERNNNDRTNELSDVKIHPLEPKPTKCKPQPVRPANYQQHRILHPELSSSSLPSTSLPSTAEQEDVCAQTLNINQPPTKQQTSVTKYKPTLGQQVLVNSALRRNRRHTLARVS